MKPSVLEQSPQGVLGATLISALVATLVLLLGIAPVAAHEHKAANAHQGEGQVLGNGQNHPRFLDTDPGQSVLFVSCEEFGDIAGQSQIGPAWYGLETAHHGPDAATPGKGDGCYMIEGGLSPLNPASVSNEAIE
jgi:hypothetical protein